MLFLDVGHSSLSAAVVTFVQVRLPPSVAVNKIEIGKWE